MSLSQEGEESKGLATICLALRECIHFNAAGGDSYLLSTLERICSSKSYQDTSGDKWLDLRNQSMFQHKRQIAGGTQLAEQHLWGGNRIVEASGQNPALGLREERGDC